MEKTPAQRDAQEFRKCHATAADYLDSALEELEAARIPAERHGWPVASHNEDLIRRAKANLEGVAR